MKYLVLLLVLAAVWATWTVPKPIAAVGTGFAAEDIYTDPTTNVTHFLYFHVLVEPWINYMQLNRQGDIIFQSNFSIPEVYYYADARLIGIGDGQHLFVVLNGKKKQPAYVADIFFADSSDGGKTWSPFIAVPREKMNDTNNRFTNCVLYINETGRTYLFYHIQEDKIAFVTRPKASAVFTIEKVIYTDVAYKQLAPSLMATYSGTRNQQIVHLFWVNIDSRKNFLYYMNTTTNGASWTTATKLINDELPSGNVLASESFLRISNLTLLTYQKRDQPLRLIYTNSSGISWYGPINFTNHVQSLISWNYRINWMAMCGSVQKPQLVALTQTEQNQLEYSVWDLRTMTVRRPVHPYTHYKRLDGALVSCVRNPKKPSELLITAIVQAEAENNVRAMTVAYDSLPAVPSEITDS